MMHYLMMITCAALLTTSSNSQSDVRKGSWHSGEIRLAQFQSNDSCFGCPSNERQLCYFQCEADKQEKDGQCLGAWWLSESSKQNCLSQNFQS
jgi:hypothetical protein